MTGLVPVRAQLNVVVDELQKVFVLGGDDGSDAGRRGLPGQGADDVVGLVARQFDRLDSHRLDDLAHPRQLFAQVVGHRRAAALVVLEFLVPHGLAAGIEDDGAVVRLFLLEKAPQHGREPVCGVRGDAGPRRQVGERVVGAVNLVVRVDQTEFFGGHNEGSRLPERRLDRTAQTARRP